MAPPSGRDRVGGHPYGLFLRFARGDPVHPGRAGSADFLHLPVADQHLHVDQWSGAPDLAIRRRDSRRVFGLALALDVTSGQLNLEGVALAIMAALGITLVVVLNNRLVGTDDSRPITLHMMLSAMTLFVVVTLVLGDFALPQTGLGWTGILVGTSAYAFAIVTIFIAMSYAGAVPAALSLNLEPVASMFFGFVILGQTLSALQISGAALVIAAVLSVRLADIRKPGYQGEPLS